MIILPKFYGTCMGSQRAIDIALSHANKDTVVYKELLHNEELLKYLEELGLKCVNELPLDKEVIIRAHGEAKSTYDFLEKNNIKYYDATCINVKRVLNIIDEYYKEGYKIIIIGKKNHPEVIAEAGWCNNEAIIIDDINNLPIIKDRILVICQTTIGTDYALNIVDKLKFLNPQLVFINTICKMQELNQESAKSVASISDYMIVIGGKKSSNTKELFSICNNICKTYLVSSKNELIDLINEIKPNEYDKIGLTAGASTPKFITLEYKKIIEKYIEKNKI